MSNASTLRAETIPCSIAPSMNPRQPLAQSAFAKKTRPDEDWSSPIAEDSWPGRDTPQVPFEYGSTFHSYP